MKKLLKVLLALLIVCGEIAISETSHVEAASTVSKVITDKNKVKGSNFTESSTLASKLDQIFAGNLPLYKGSSKVSAPLGSSKLKNDSSHNYTAKATNNSGKTGTGTSCFIGASAAYSALWGDLVSYVGSQQESLTIPSGTKMTYASFTKLGVRFGAYIRVNRTVYDKNKKKNVITGHSIIILTYDSKTVTYLDYNGDGNGLAAVRTYSWNNLPNVLKPSVGWIAKVIQPKLSYYQTFFEKRDLKVTQLSSNSIEVSGTITSQLNNVPVTLVVTSSTTTLCSYKGTLSKGKNNIQTVFTANGNSNTKLPVIKLGKADTYTVTVYVTTFGRKYSIYTKKITIKTTA